MTVSCLMPTADRHAFIGTAIAGFLRQTYADRELLILDSGRESVADLVPDHPRIRYWRTEEPPIMGAARNWLAARARGEVLVHWDDDDWHGPTRLAVQVTALARARADICGLKAVPFLTDDRSAAWDYVWSLPRPWVYGASFAYRRDHWARYPFPEIQVGEDNVFVLDNPGRVLAIPDTDWIVFRVHGSNTSQKQTDGLQWIPRDPGPLIARIAAWAR